MGFGADPEDRKGFNKVIKNKNCKIVNLNKFVNDFSQIWSETSEYVRIFYCGTGLGTRSPAKLNAFKDFFIKYSPAISYFINIHSRLAGQPEKSLAYHSWRDRCLPRTL